MVIWNKKLYFGDSVKKKHRKIIRSVDRGKLCTGVYCIAFASNPANLFDIIPARELLFPVYRHIEVHILGLAGSREEAVALVVDMLLKMHYDTGDFKVREYFMG